MCGLCGGGACAAVCHCKHWTSDGHPAGLAADATRCYHCAARNPKAMPDVCIRCPGSGRPRTLAELCLRAYERYRAPCMEDIWVSARTTAQDVRESYALSVSRSPAQNLVLTMTPPDRNNRFTQLHLNFQQMWNFMLLERSRDRHDPEAVAQHLQLARDELNRAVRQYNEWVQREQDRIERLGGRFAPC